MATNAPTHPSPTAPSIGAPRRDPRPAGPAHRRLALLLAVALLAGLAPLLGSAAPASASGPHVYPARGLDIVSGKASPWPSSTAYVQAGRHLTDISVTLRNVKHGCVKDLDIMLVHGDRRTLLMSDVGDNGVTFSCYRIVAPVLNIDDDCGSFPNPIPSGARQEPGQGLCYRPTDVDGGGHQNDDFFELGTQTQAVSLWEAFGDVDPTGTWSLHVVDDGFEDTGTIGSWELNITTSDQPVVGGETTVDVHKGSATTFTVPGHDPDGEPLACRHGGFPTKGTVSGDFWDTSCTRTYTAGARTAGQDVTSFGISDIGGHSAASTVRFTIVNRAPVPWLVERTVRAGESVALPLGGTDPDPNESVGCTQVQGAQLGRVDGGDCTRSYVAGSQPGLDSFTYAVFDDFGGWATGTVRVTVTATTPTAEARAVTAPKGSGTAITLSGVDPDGRPTTCEVDPSSAQGKVTLSGTGCTRTVRPRPDTSGTDTFTYAVRNDTGQVSARATVTVTIPNRAPAAQAIIVVAGQGQRVDVPLPASDPDGDSVRCTTVGTTTLGTFGGTGCSRTFTAGQALGRTTVAYTVTDAVGATAQGSIQVHVVDPRPTAHPVAVTATKGSPVAIALGGDVRSVAGDAVTCQAPRTTTQAKGTLSGSGCALTYTANPRTSGTDTFTYTVSDGDLVSAPATVTISVANRAPIAPTQRITLPVSDSVAVALGGTDPDPGEGVALTCSPALGATTRGTVSGQGCFVTYKAGATAGTDSFAYTVRDAGGATATGRVEVTIAGTSPAGCSASDGPTARYVCRTYLDLLGRTADVGGKDYWVARLDRGEHRASVIKAFTGTTEFRASVVRGVHRALLGTDPDAATTSRWVAELGRGADPDRIRQEVLASAAFWARAGSTPEGWAEGVHQQVLRQPATSAEVTALATELRTGTSRATVAGRLLRTTAADVPTVASIYERFLRRTPPASETTYWVGRLQGGDDELAMLRLIVAAPEYHDRA